MKALILFLISLPVCAGIPWEFVRTFGGEFYVSAKLLDPDSVTYYDGYHYRCWWFQDGEGYRWVGVKIDDVAWHALLKTSNRTEALTLLNGITWEEGDNAQCDDPWTAPKSVHP